MTDDEKTFNEKLKVWAYYYPLTAAIMNNQKLSDEEVLRLVRLSERRLKEKYGKT